MQIVGKITLLNEQDGRANVKFFNQRCQNNLKYKFIVPLPTKYQRIREGDYVMCNVINEHDQDCWIPARVFEITSDKKNDQQPIYSVIYYNGLEGQNSVDQVIKINENRFFLFADYILNIMYKK